MKNIKKIIAFWLITIILVFACCTISYASVSGTFNGSDEGEGFITAIIGMILPAVRAVAAGVAIIGITIMGTRYMAAAPTERAEIKDTIIKFVAGILLVVGATEIVGWLQEIAGSV